MDRISQTESPVEARNLRCTRFSSSWSRRNVLRRDPLLLLCMVAVFATLTRQHHVEALALHRRSLKIPSADGFVAKSFAKIITSSPRWRMVADSRQLRFLGTERFFPAATSDVVSTSISQFTLSQHGNHALVGAGLFGAFSSSSGANSASSSASTGTSTVASPVAATSSTARRMSQFPRQGFGPSIQLTDEETRLFNLLRHAREATGLETTLRVAGGWVRDKLLASAEFETYHKVLDIGGKRLTSKFQKPAPSMGRQGTKVLVSTEDGNNAPVDIDIALDDMLGREFADHLNEYLSSKGEDTVSVGVVLKNPEKSKHLETATMKVDSFWIDFVNLRAEEYTQDSRIPDLMRIGTAEEDAFRRDLTINALFFNINTGQVEDWTGRGFEDLRRGIVATPLAPLTTLLDDPLRVLRSVRFAARLRFTIDEELRKAALDDRVRTALAQKVSRERVGGEVDLMLRSPDPVGAMRLLINLRLAPTVFPLSQLLAEYDCDSSPENIDRIFSKGLGLLSTAHEHLADCRLSPPLWCVACNPVYADSGPRLVEDSESRRMLWYAAFLKPLWDETAEWRAKQEQEGGTRGRKANRSIISKLLVDSLKRPTRDAEAVEKILRASSELTDLVSSGSHVSATMILLSEVRVSAVDHDTTDDPSNIMCNMNGRRVDPVHEEDPLWTHSMEFRQQCADVLQKVGTLWRASLILSISEELVWEDVSDSLDYAIEGDTVQESRDEERQGVIHRFDVFAAALHQLGVIGIWNQRPLLDGDAIKKVLPRIPRGPAFRHVMEEQAEWMVEHPGASAEALHEHLLVSFPDFGPTNEDTSSSEG